MAYRSWLKDVRKINDLGQHLYHSPKGKEDWDRLDEYEKKSLELNTRSVPVASDYEKYFGGKAIFSYVIGTERVGDRFEVHLYDRSAHGFVMDYAEMKGIEIDDCRARVVLVFDGVTYANSVRPDAEGWLKHADISTWRPTNDLMATDRILLDWFYEQDGSTQWIGQFMKYEPDRSNPQSDVFLLVDFKTAYARDERASAIRSLAGDECLQLWNEFRDQSAPGRLNGSQLDLFLRERLNV